MTLNSPSDSLSDYLTSELQALKMIGGEEEEKMEIDNQVTLIYNDFSILKNWCIIDICFFHSLGQNIMFTAVIKQLDFNHFY